MKKLSFLCIIGLTLCIQANAQLLRGLSDLDVALKPNKDLICDNKSHKFSTSVSARSQLKLKDNEVWWGYFNGVYEGSDPYDWRKMGWGGNLTYSCAIKIEPTNRFGLGKGKTIEGIRFTFPDTKNMSNISIWISNKLPLDRHSADANICYMPLEKENLVCGKNPSKNGEYVNEIRFEKPYLIESDDVYIGYTFDMGEAEDSYDQCPFVLMARPHKIIQQKNGYYVRCDEEEWDNRDGQEDVIAMQVLFSGDFKQNAVEIPSDFNDVVMKSSSENNLVLVLTNMGKESLKQFKYSVYKNGEIDGEPKEVKLDKPIKGIGERYEYNFPINSYDQEGLFDLKLTINQVNNNENEIEGAFSQGDLIILKSFPLKKVLMEDITGTWGSGAAFGFINKQKAKQIFKNRIVPITLHIGKQDPMTCRDYSPYTKYANIRSIPSVNLDRSVMDLYPYYSFTGETFEYDFDKFVDSLMSIPAVAAINAFASFNEDETEINCGANVEFAYDGIRGDYALFYVLTEDGMSDNSWIQKNGLVQYKGKGLEEYDPLFDRWVNGESEMKGIIYDDVAIAALGIVNGLDNSISIPFKKGEKQIHKEKFSLVRYPLVKDKNQLSVCVALINTKSGKIINADKVKLVSADNTGVSTVDNQKRVLECYTIEGVKIPHLQHGINIVKYSDGSTDKIILE